MTSFAAQECGSGPQPSGSEAKQLERWEVGRHPASFLRRFARCRRNVPDSDFTGVSGLEAEFLEETVLTSSVGCVSRSCGVAVK